MKVLRSLSIGPSNDLFDFLKRNTPLRFDYVDPGDTAASKREVHLYRENKRIHVQPLGKHLDDGTFTDLIAYTYLEHFHTSPWEHAQARDTVSRSLNDLFNYLTGKDLFEQAEKADYLMVRHVTGQYDNVTLYVAEKREFKKNWLKTTWEIPLNKESRNLGGISKRNMALTVVAEFDGTVQPARDFQYVLDHDLDLAFQLKLPYRDTIID